MKGKQPGNLTEAGSNDDLMTELEFTEALSGLSKDAAPGPGKVKYSDIKNLSADDKSELFTLYEAWQQDRFPRTGHTVTSNQSPNREKIISN